MISVRVNEILKYLSTDKKERLKKCVQVMESVQKLDNTRTQRNNISNTTSSPSLSSSSSCVSVAEEEPSAEESMPKGQLSGKLKESAAVTSMSNEGNETKKKKNREKFQSGACDRKLAKDCKKRRPLTVLKSQNVQCARDESPSISQNSSSLPGTKSQSIPKDTLLEDVKLNGLSWLVLPKTKVQTNSKTTDSADELPVDSKSEKKSGTGISVVAKDCTGQIENHKHSCQKTATQKDEIRCLETRFEQKTDGQEKKTNEVDDLLSLLRSDVSSSSCALSRKSKKQNKNKDSGCGKMQRMAKSPCRRSKPSAEEPSLGSIETLPNVGEKRSPKAPQGKGVELSHREKKDLNLRAKENKLGKSKVDPVRLNGYKSSSGVAELDTFEVASLKEKLLKKRCADVSPTEALNELDTFDEPIVTALRRHSNESLGIVPTTPEIAEKWIEVNRKVKRVAVPLNVVSRILGSDGSKLEAICNVTKAHIEQEKSGNVNETTFVIRGTLEQMQAAYSLISALIKDHGSQDSILNGCTLLSKQGSAVDLALHRSSDKQNARNSAKELKARAKLQRLPVVNSAGNATNDKVNSTQIGGQQQDEEYQESVKSGTSERSDDQNCSERSSPAQDLLIGEYSLFEHGLGQPLEKLLACKDSSKQTFACAAGSRSSSRTLTISVPNSCIVDQTLLAKAPGYRNVKSLKSRDLYCPKVRDFSVSQFGRVAFPRKCSEQISGSETSFSFASHLLPINSKNVNIPLLERPISAPNQLSPHSAFAAPPSHSAAIHTFSKLNPNAPDFIFATSSDAVGVNHSSNSRDDGLLAPAVDTSGCNQNGAESAYSYVMSFNDSGFKPSVEALCSNLDGATCQGPALVTSEETMYALPVGDGLSSSWISSQDSWHAPKMSYGVFGGEHASAGTYPLRSYFTHPVLTSSTSPYNCAFYQQQQHLMLAPVQSWVQGSQTLAQAGP